MNAEKTTSQVMPPGISEFINQQFRENFLTRFKTAKDAHGKTIYFVDVSQDETNYHLKFSESGVLMNLESEPLMEFPDDDVAVFDD